MWSQKDEEEMRGIDRLAPFNVVKEAQANCKLCEEPIGAVELIRRQKVTDTEFREEHFHEQCWFEKLLEELNENPD